jgi:hypothetical protein
MLKYNFAKGFTLFELALLIVISSTLIFGFLKGQDLIMRAGLNKIINEVTTYRAAIATYHLAYGYYPGDDPNAASYFDTVSNGDGDDNIEWASESINADYAIMEGGLMPLGTTYTAYDYSLVNRLSGYKNSRYHPPTTCAALNNEEIGINCHQLGSSLHMNEAVLKPRDHYWIDSKLDDGKPLSGKIRFRIIKDVNSTTCGDSSGYFLDKEEVGCNLTYDITVE